MAEKATIAVIPPDDNDHPAAMSPSNRGVLPISSIESLTSEQPTTTSSNQLNNSNGNNLNLNNTYTNGNGNTGNNNNEFAVTSVATVSAPWQYDAMTSRCHGCHTGFTIVNRRHHCRLCGNIFCQKCSDQKALIPPASIVLVPDGGKKAKPRSALQDSLDPYREDPDRMLTYISSQAAAQNNNNPQELLYGKGLEERLQLARAPLRVCRPCHGQLQNVQAELKLNSNSMRFNVIDPTDNRRLFNSPLAFTLGHEVRKAAYTLNNLLPLPKRMGSVLAPTVSAQRHNPENLFPDESLQSDLQACKENCSTVSPNLANIDGVRIPARLLELARGVAVLTVLKTGFGLAGIEFGTGLVTARLGPNQWSAPSAIGTAGMSWGALVGAQVTDHVFLLMTDKAVRCFFQRDNNVQLGVDVGVAVGPLGRAVEADLSIQPGNVAPVYTYSQSKGLYAGVSLDGKVVVTRHEVNEKFYGSRISGAEILSGSIPSPPAAEPLYAALQRCHVYATRDAAVRMISQYPQVQTQRLVADEYGESPRTAASYNNTINDVHSVAVSELTSEYY